MKNIECVNINEGFALIWSALYSRPIAQAHCQVDHDV